MDSLSRGIALNPSKQSETFFHNHIKHLSSKSSEKALGASGNTELANWYEEAYAYYQAVQSGQEPRPEGGAWQEFLEQMQWAYQQLMGQGQANWEPVASNGEVSEASATDPFGGMRGTDGAWVHTEAEAYVGFLGNQQRHIWSNDITIDVASLAAQVDVVISQDNSTQPPEEVLKIRVYDSATGTEDVYTIHDYADAEISINTPGPNQINDQTNAPNPLFEIGEFNPKSAISSDQASVPGEALDNRENTFLYEGRIGQRIDFFPEASGSSGEVETHVVYGDAMISTRPTDEVAVTQDNEGVMIIEVTHRDGSVDRFEVQAGYEVQLMAREETLTIDGNLYGDLNDLPETYEDILGINQGLETESAVNPHPDNSEADRVESGVAYYNSSDLVSLHNEYEGEIESYEIVTGGTVEIGAHNYQDRVFIYLESDGSYRLEITNPEFPGEKRIYHVEGPPSRVQLHGFLPGQVHAFTGAPNPQKIFNFLDGATSRADTEDLEDLLPFQVEAENAIQPAQALNEVEREQEEEEEEAIEWPNNQLSNHVTGNSDASNDALDFIRHMEEAIQADQGRIWQQLTLYIHNLSNSRGNDVIRKFVTALFLAVDSDMAALHEVLDIIPASVRQAMMDKVVEHGGELGESHEGDLFNSQGAWDQISASLHDDED